MRSQPLLAASVWLPGLPVRLPARGPGQATDRDGTVYALPDTERPTAQCPRLGGDPGRRQGWGPGDRRPQSNRGRCVNGQPTQRHRRDQDTRQARRTPADTAHTVVVEDLNTQAGTASAKGTGTEPDRNLKRKAGRHRSLDLAIWGAEDYDRLPHNQEGIEALCHRLTVLAPNRIVVEATGGREESLATSRQAGACREVVNPRHARAFGRAS